MSSQSPSDEVGSQSTAKIIIAAVVISLLYLGLLLFIAMTAMSLGSSGTPQKVLAVLSAVIISLHMVFLWVMWRRKRSKGGTNGNNIPLGDAPPPPNMGVVHNPLS